MTRFQAMFENQPVGPTRTTFGDAYTDARDFADQRAVTGARVGKVRGGFHFDGNAVRRGPSVTVQRIVVR